MYKGSRFSIKDDETIMGDIGFAAQHCRHQERLFLCDGDALILPQKRLVKILNAIKTGLPWVTRIGTYANTKAIKRKSIEELKELHALGLGIAYMGLETGDDVTLKAINKGADSAQMIEMGKKIRECGIKLSITVLLGIAEKKRSHIHAKETGRVLSEIDPEYVGALTLMLRQGVPMFDAPGEDEFHLLNAAEMLEELGIMFANSQLTNGYFHANHASNYLPIKAKLPEDRDATLSLINKALKRKVDLKPEYMRAL